MGLLMVRFLIHCIRDSVEIKARCRFIHVLSRADSVDTSRGLPVRVLWSIQPDQSFDV